MPTEPVARCNLCEPPQLVAERAVPQHLFVVHGLVDELHQQSKEVTRR